MQQVLKVIVDIRGNFVVPPAMSREVCREKEPAVVVIPPDGCVLASGAAFNH